MNKNLLMLSTSEWGASHWFRRQYFSRYLADSGWRVFYVNPRKTITRVFLDDPWNGIKNMVGPLSWSIPPGHDRVAVFDPSPSVPCYFRSPTMAKYGRLLYKQRLHAAAQRFFSSGDYVQVVYHPYDFYSVDLALPLVYEVVDKFDAYPEYRRTGNKIADAHFSMSSKASRIVVTVDSLIPHGCETKTSIIPNGVDLGSFIACSGMDCPDDLAQIRPPRAIYVGALLDWFDYDMLCQAARDLPGVNFVIIGFPKFDCPVSLPNIHYLGAKRQSELPAYLKNSQVGIIPFKPGALTENVNPLKFYEYLAADIPCVSVPMRAIASFVAPGVLSVASDVGSFAACIRMQLASGHVAAHQGKRRSLSVSHDWKTLADRFGEIVSEVL